mmetsp:Transcript_25915/g.63786  ORF Transcript_25915/g.63786 Transcript_25915/m.63786 type:complete len:240 (-) Transcript_25915:11-730(-)
MTVDSTISTRITNPTAIAPVELFGSFSSKSIRSRSGRFVVRCVILADFSLSASSNLRGHPGGYAHSMHVACHRGSRTETTEPSRRTPGETRGTAMVYPSLWLECVSTNPPATSLLRTCSASAGTLNVARMSSCSCHSVPSVQYARRTTLPTLTNMTRRWLEPRMDDSSSRARTGTMNTAILASSSSSFTPDARARAARDTLPLPLQQHTAPPSLQCCKGKVALKFTAPPHAASVKCPPQ